MPTRKNGEGSAGGSSRVQEQRVGLRHERGKRDDESTTTTTLKTQDCGGAVCPEPKKLLAVRRPSDELRFGNSQRQSVSQPASEAAPSDEPTQAGLAQLRTHHVSQSPLAQTAAHYTRPSSPREGSPSSGPPTKQTGGRTKHEQKEKESQGGYTSRGLCGPLRQ